MRALGTAILLASLCIPSAARAQLPEAPAAPSDADVAQARERFVHGMALAQREEWIAALDEFARSYALSGSPVALFNIGSTLRALQRFRDARDAFDRLLADPELDAQTRQAAEDLRTEVAAQVGRVTVDGVPEGHAEITADEEAREPIDARPIEIELDPGPHTLAIDVPAYAPWRWAGSVAPGAELRLSATMAPTGSSFDPLPWILGAGAAVVVGLVVGLVVADVEAQLAPRTSMVIVLP